MAAQWEQLDPDAALMLYASEELSLQEREAMDARLAAEPALALRLEQLRASRQICFDALEHADQQNHLPSSHGVAVRRVARAMRQWQLDRTIAYRSVVVAQRRLRIPGWAYPTAAAAMILIGFLVWSVRQPVNAVMPASPQFTDYVATQQNDLADWMTDSLRGSRDDFRADAEFYAVSSNATANVNVTSDLDGIFLRDDSEQ